MTHRPGEGYRLFRQALHYKSARWTLGVAAAIVAIIALADIFAPKPAVLELNDRYVTTPTGSTTYAVPACKEKIPECVEEALAACEEEGLACHDENRKRNKENLKCQAADRKVCWTSTIRRPPQAKDFWSDPSDRYDVYILLEDGTEIVRNGQRPGVPIVIPQSCAEAAPGHPCGKVTGVRFRNPHKDRELLVGVHVK